jgi:hypothetical protein
MTKSPGADSIFTLSILFRNPTKFKIMQNGKKPNGSGPGSHIAPFTERFTNLITERCKDLIDEGKFVRRHNYASDRFSLKPDDLQRLLSVPGFVEISIFPGVQDGEIVLFLVPVVRVNKKNELQDAAEPPTELVCVYEETTNLNGEDRTSSTVATLTAAPCPPYPPGCRNCCPPH